jgi:hypothetical protein
VAPNRCTKVTAPTSPPSMPCALACSFCQQAIASTKIYPPQGSSHMEGHASFCTRGQGAWGDDVLAFLRNPPK